MDRLDREILRILHGDGRRSYTDIGESVHLSANAVAERVRRMTREGTIRGVRVVVDPLAFGKSVEAQIDVKLSQGVSAAAFEGNVRVLPQVLVATLMTGSYDYALRVSCTDREELATVTEAIRNSAGASETCCHLILREVQLNPW